MTELKNDRLLRALCAMYVVVPVAAVAIALSATLGASFDYLYAGVRYRRSHDLGTWHGRFVNLMRARKGEAAISER